jgi:hypothetical protein
MSYNSFWRDNRPSVLATGRPGNSSDPTIAGHLGIQNVPAEFLFDKSCWRFINIKICEHYWLAMFFQPHILLIISSGLDSVNELRCGPAEWGATHFCLIPANFKL